MLDVILFSCLFAKLKGYKWSEIFKIFKHWSAYPIILTCLLNIYIIFLMIQGNYWFLQYAKHIKNITFLLYILLIIKYKLINVSIFKNINLKNGGQLITSLTSPVIIGAVCATIGSKLNKIAMFYNDGKMPVFPSNSLSTGFSKIDMFEKTSVFNDFHAWGNHTTKLIFLTDTWDIFYVIMSPGDILIKMFAGMVLYYSYKQCNENLNKGKNKIMLDNQV